MLELYIIKVFEKLLLIPFENVLFAFGLSKLIFLWGPYNKEHTTRLVYLCTCTCHNDIGRASHRPAFRESMFIDMHDIDSVDESTLCLLYTGINVHVVELSILYVKTQVDKTMIILFVVLHVKRLQVFNLPKTKLKTEILVLHLKSIYL